MINLIYTRGFDSVISSGMTVDGDLTIPKNHVLLIEGTVTGNFIISEQLRDTSWLHVSGGVDVNGDITVSNLHITGNVRCNNLICTGILSFNKTASLTAKTITYKVINLEPGAVVTGAFIPEAK